MPAEAEWIIQRSTTDPTSRSLRKWTRQAGASAGKIRRGVLVTPVDSDPPLCVTITVVYWGSVSQRFFPLDG